MIKLVAINHSFQTTYNSRRWKLFADSHPDVDVTLLAPTEYSWYNNKKFTYGGEGYTLRGKTVDQDNFHIKLFRPKKHKLGGYTSDDFKSILKSIEPDVVYVIGGHNTNILKQIIKLREKNHPSMKVIAFSMRGPALTLKIKQDKCSPLRWIARRIIYSRIKRIQDYIYSNVDAFFCHYPDAVDCFRKEGYNGPIYMQTQVGVNEEWFHEDIEARKEIRFKYGISDSTFVFGSATRFAWDKGVDVILKALPKDGDWKYLMMGSGSEEEIERLRTIIKERNLGDKVIETGFVDWYDMAKYWNALDCSIHVPITTDTWEETFSLSAIQPQITKKPVIGDTSGSVPYQIGFEEMIVPENNVEALHEKIKWMLTHKEEALVFGQKMYQRTHDSFEVLHLNEMFYDTIVEDIIPGTYDVNKFDMVKYPSKRTPNLL